MIGITIRRIPRLKYVILNSTIHLCFSLSSIHLGACIFIELSPRPSPITHALMTIDDMYRYNSCHTGRGESFSPRRNCISDQIAAVGNLRIEFSFLQAARNEQRSVASNSDFILP
eukprot:COSAG02_NODE_2302_length_9186_cov_25.811269_6_plen_115_part_00